MAADRETDHLDDSMDPPGQTRRVHRSIVFSLVGMLMIAAGLAVDFVVHANGQGLAAAEGVFTLRNVGHALVAIGIAATAVGLGLAAWRAIRHSQDQSRMLWVSTIAAGLGVIIVLGSVAYVASGPAFSHDHGDDGQGQVALSEHDHDVADTGQADQSRVPREEGMALAMLSWSRSSSLGEGDSHHHDGDHIDVEDLTDEEQEELAKQFEAASVVVDQYMDVEQALAAGYSQTSPRVDGVGYHFTKWSLVDKPFDIARPSQLLYEEVTFGAGLELVALSYWVASDHAPEGFAGEADAWHQHFGTCFVNGYLVDEGVPNRDSCDGDWVNGSDLWMIHAWIIPGMENEAGVFSAANPRICERICAAEN